MELGIYFRSFFTNPTRPLHEQIDDAVEICHVARDCGFAAITMPQHWVSHPTIWPQPFPMLARLAPEVGEMRLQTGIVLLPLHNPLQVAEDVATLDHIAKGRFVLGVGLGYRDTELEAIGSNRKQRVSRMSESIEVMKKLWTGEEIDHEGKYWTVHGAKMGFTPIQKPHPPIWIACQSEGAVRRSARIADAAYLAPQVGFDDVAHLISIYRDERGVTGQDAGHITISRGVALAKDKETAIAEARESAASSYKMYSSWNMQEDTMVKINIASDSEVSAWAVSGNGDDCLQDLGRLAADGVEYVGMTLLNMPKDLSGRKEYIQALAENVLHRMK